MKLFKTKGGGWIVATDIACAVEVFKSIYKDDPKSLEEISSYVAVQGERNHEQR